MQGIQKKMLVNEQVNTNVANLGIFETHVKLQCHGYDSFIDFLKGFCIISVILTHCIPESWKAFILFDLWGVAAVPLFLIIQVFHTYKKGLECVSIHFLKIWNRIIKPFVWAELLCLVLVESIEGHEGTLLSFIKNNLYWGGFGVGAYYPWIYVQFSIMLPLLVFVFEKIKGYYLLLLFIVISEGMEVVCCLSGIPEWLYRLSFLRYTFLLYLGYMITKEGCRINRRTLTISVISIIFTLFFVHSNVNCEPVFFTSLSGWKTCHWVCYFNIAYLLFYLIWLLNSKFKEMGKYYMYALMLGKYSYEIFLVQMIYFCFYPLVQNFLISIIGSIILANIIGIIISVIICVVPVLLYKQRILLIFKK